MIRKQIVLDKNKNICRTLLAIVDENNTVINYVVAWEYIPACETWLVGNYFDKTQLMEAIELLHYERED